LKHTGYWLVTVAVFEWLTQARAEKQPGDLVNASILPRLDHF
jgi:hypothetical protein